METPVRNDNSYTEIEGQNAVTAALEALARTRRLSESTLTVELKNAVEYFDDIGDPSQFATQPGSTPPNTPKNFFVVTLIADIVSVNGDPAKGAYVGRTRVVSLNAEAVADVTRTALREHVFEILQPNGTAIGTIMSTGFSGGPPPPGAPAVEHGNWAIVGGTGAFLGARGTVGGMGGLARSASMREDPKNRRSNGGTSYPFILHIIPMEPPRVVETALGPAIHKSNSSLVTHANPALPNEHLYLIATGLGPTVPAVDLGTAFPSNPPCAVNSPISITVNGIAAQVLGAAGVPGAVDVYRVDFKAPNTHGNTSVQLTAAWIKGPVVSMAVWPV
jgi:hypothetical protein